MEVRALFGIPLYSFWNPHHEEMKVAWDKFVVEDAKGMGRDAENALLKYTTPNLHTHEVFANFREFAGKCVAEAMEDLGYEPNFEFTAIWGTLHEKGGSHHHHTHHNAFLAGVYYLHGVPGMTAGTTFFNHHIMANVIDPRRKSGATRRILPSEVIFFEEGKLIIFPAWAAHNTGPNTNDDARRIIAFNVMPVGKSNNDPFDRYVYKAGDYTSYDEKGNVKASNP